MYLKNKKILLGITGGIAAYKCVDLVRQLKKQGAEVRVVLTMSAARLVSPFTLQVVSGNVVNQSLFRTDAELSMAHIELAQWADLVIIAPATANIIAKLVHGIADDLLSTLCLATTAVIVVLPAMNKEMYLSVATQENLAILRKRCSVQVWGPDVGEQACGDVGIGRMLEPVVVVGLINDFFASRARLTDLRIVITAGPTHERLDPVRYISNYSSGQMGFALAKSALQLGAQVTLITGPVSLTAPIGVIRVDVVSAQEMYREVMARIDQADIFIACAAVADYRPVDVCAQKIKRDQDYMEVTLVKNPDIVADVAKRVTAGRPFVVGFAAETEDIEKHALKKLKDKQLALICANDVSALDQGFNSTQNAVVLYTNNSKKSFPLMDKNQLAKALIGEIINHYETKNCHQSTG